MSSTYVHYAAPSSLPSDYALLSRYAAANPDAAAGANEQAESSNVAPSSCVDENEDENAGVDIHPNGVGIGRSLSKRRSSFPTSYITPFNPTMGPLPDKHGHRSGPHLKDPNENTPLLAPPVPRIEEECDAASNDDATPFSEMLREEARILAKYTLPVFGYVPFYLSYSSHVDLPR